MGEKKGQDLWMFGLRFHTSGDFSVVQGKRWHFFFRLVYTLQYSHVVISVFDLEGGIIVDNLFRKDSKQYEI